MVNFSTKLPFSSSFLFFFPSFPLSAVSLERIILRYELGIYNYTSAVIGFSSFFPSFLLFLSLSFSRSRPPFSENIAHSSAFLFISESRLIRAPARPTEKFPIIHRDRLSEHGRCPAKGKSESASLDIALTGVTIVTPRPRAKWPILLK